MTLIGHGQTLSDISTEPAGPTWQVAQSVKVTDLPDGTLVSPYGEKVVSFNNLPMNARQILGYRGFMQNDATGERLPFEDGALIHAKNKKAGIPVKVWEPDPRCEAEYPSAIVITDPRIMEAMRQMMEGPGPKIFYRFRYPPN